MNVTVCRIASDADYACYVLKGSSLTDAAVDIETLIKGASAIFERDARVSFPITTAWLLARADGFGLPESLDGENYGSYG